MLSILLNHTPVVNSSMRNGDKLWNDGLTDSCANNGQVQYRHFISFDHY